jgi:hypothetical protein
MRNVLVILFRRPRNEMFRIRMMLATNSATPFNGSIYFIERKLGLSPYGWEQSAEECIYMYER